MKKAIYILIFIAAATDAFGQFNQNSSRSLFSDVKAYQEGDALMILIMENTQAGNSASTSSDRSSGVDFGLGVGTGGASNTNIDGNINTGSDFGSNGQTSRNESIRSRLSVRVVQVEDNGNLRIVGTRETTINKETQTFRIEGSVRPVDITPDNTVYSYNVLDLKLVIEGDGVVSEVQEPGLITKFLRFLF